MKEDGNRVKEINVSLSISQKNHSLLIIIMGVMLKCSCYQQLTDSSSSVTAFSDILVLLKKMTTVTPNKLELIF